MRIPNDKETIEQFEDRFKSPQNKVKDTKIVFNAAGLAKFKNFIKSFPSFILNSMIRNNEKFYNKMTVIWIHEYQFTKIEAKNFLCLLNRTLKLSEMKVSFRFAGDNKFPKLFFANFLTIYKNNRHLNSLKLFHLYVQNLTIVKRDALGINYEYEKIFYAVSKLILTNEALSYIEGSSDSTEENPVSLNLIRATERRNRGEYNNQIVLNCYSVKRNIDYDFYKEHVAGLRSY